MELKADVKGDILDLLRASKNGEITLKDGASLREVKKIIYSDRVKAGRLELPSLWMVADSYQPQALNNRIEIHDLPYWFVVLVKDRKIEQGKEVAESIVAKVCDLLLDNRAVISCLDIIPEKVDLAYNRSDRNHVFWPDTKKNVYWSAVKILFRVRRIYYEL